MNKEARKIIRGEIIINKLDKIIDLLTVLTETMTEDTYIRSRQVGAEIYDPREYED